MAERIKLLPRARLTVRPGKKDAIQVTSKPTEPNAQEYLPTEQEFAALQKQKVRLMACQWKPQLKVENGKIVPDHPDKVIGMGLVAEALGVGVDCAQGLLDQLAGFAGRGDEIDQASINNLLALVREIGPTNGIEAMLAVQMAAVHVNAVMVGRRLVVHKTSWSRTAQRARSTSSAGPIRPRWRPSRAIGPVERMSRCRMCWSMRAARRSWLMWELQQAGLHRVNL